MPDNWPRMRTFHWRISRQLVNRVLLLVTILCAASLLVVGVSHVTSGMKSAEHTYSSMRGRVRGQIRSGRQLLPISAREMALLERTPLQQWGDTQRKLLIMSNRPWLTATPDECSSLEVTFSSNVPLTALVSLPSSGNSWLRYLIEGATGVFTGSVYADLTLVKAGMFGEAVPFDSGTTIVQKTHGFTTKAGINATREEQRTKYSHVGQFSCRGILLIRSPLMAIRSHRHLDAGGHTGFAPSSQFQGLDWDRFVARKAVLWRHLYSDWIEQCPPENLLVVHFEKLKQNLEGEIQRIVTFLGRKIDPDRMRCLLKYPNGRLKRKRKQPLSLEETFTDRHRVQVRREEELLDAVLRRYGFDGMPQYS